MNDPLRVMIIEDSRVVRDLLRAIIDEDERLTVVADVATGEEALHKLDGAAPDIITMDVCLPGMNGIEATRRIMTERPTPIVIIAAIDGTREVDLGLEALRAGAVHVIDKPRVAGIDGYLAVGRQICNRLVAMSDVILVRNRRPLPCATVQAPAVTRRPRRQCRMVAIAASTGGPKALVELFNALGGDFPVPIALVQHIDPGFVVGFARWLEEVTPFEARLVGEAVQPRPGVVYIADPERHLKGNATIVRAEFGPPVGQNRPSADVLFQSLAGSLGEAAIGVLLTGMGADGAAGLLEMRERGAHTIAEDASTAIVYGMPKAAIERGAACESLPLPDIARRLRTLVPAEAEIDHAV